jgi:VanZ family protein
VNEFQSADVNKPALPDVPRRSSQDEAEAGVGDVRSSLGQSPETQQSGHGRGRLSTQGDSVHQPLSWIFASLIVYASLYPFTGWRNQDIFPLQFLLAPLPQYWTGFDVGANFLGYAPLGFLLALSAARSWRFRWGIAIAAAVVGAALLSLMLETAQSYLPSRIASNLDWALNTAGANIGALGAAMLQKIGVLDRWRRFRARWFTGDARGTLVLLALWPIALLFPAAVPMGLGQIFERVEAALADSLADTPFIEWLPMREIELQPLVPVAQLICVALGALIPCLLAYCVVRTVRQRVAIGICMLLAGVAASALSAALTYGPEHAWAWLDAPVQVGLACACVLAAGLLLVPQRAAAALVLLGGVVQLGLLNQAPADPYFAQTLQTWEQGRFIRFHGLVQWLGWLWPYAVLVLVFLRLTGRDPGHARAS